MRQPDAKTSDYNALLTVLGKLGMSPASRLKMDLPAAPLPVKTAAQTEEEKQWAELDELD